MKEAGPSTPVEILGLNDVPNAGEILVAPENRKGSKKLCRDLHFRREETSCWKIQKRSCLWMTLFSQIKAGNVKELGIIVKADVQGSVEAVKQSLVKLSNEEVVVKVIHGGVGAINESDVSLASASNAIIIGFNVRPDATAKSIAEQEKVDMRLYKRNLSGNRGCGSGHEGHAGPRFRGAGHRPRRCTPDRSRLPASEPLQVAMCMDGKFQRGCSCAESPAKESRYSKAPWHL